MAQPFLVIASLPTWPFLICSDICGRIPHFAELASSYSIILSSACEWLSISLQASSGCACRSLAALISLPRFSASSRSGTNPFMQASLGPVAPGGGGAAPIGCVGAPPAIGAAPFEGNALGCPNEAAGAAPLPGGSG